MASDGADESKKEQEVDKSQKEQVADESKQDQEGDESKKDQEGDELEKEGELDEDQKEALTEYMSVSCVSEEVALEALKAAEWDIDTALDNHWNKPIDMKPYEDIYEKYKDANIDMILVDGIISLCKDLEVDPGDVVMIVFSWRLHAATMCQFTRDEFVQGLYSLGIDSMDQFKERLESMRSELKDDYDFKEIFNFAYDWTKEEGQKALPLDTAIEMWRLLFSERPWPLLDTWCQFLQEKYDRPVSFDLWSQVREFAVTLDSSLSNYDPEGAWPCIMDEFVDHLKENGLVKKKEE